MERMVSLVRADREAFAPKGTPPNYAPSTPLRQRHVALDIEVDIEARRLWGSASLRLQAVADELKQVRLDAVDMRISRVRAGGKAVEHHYDGSSLTVLLEEPLGAGEETELEVGYEVQDPVAGVYFVRPDEDYPDHPTQAWTQGQDEDSRHWFPCLDTPAQKGTSEIRVRVPEGFVAVSNGDCVEKSAKKGTKAVYHYRLDVPHSPYLVALAIGRFELIEEAEGVVAVRYYGEKEQSEALRRTFCRTPEMISCYADWIGVPYPYGSYSQVAVADFVFGGMENTTATFQTDRVIFDERAGLDFDADGLVSHELAHMWFGDLVTCRSWDQAWLQEGFATFMEVIWKRHHKGEDEALHAVLQNRRAYLSEERGRYRRPIVTNRYKEPIDLFDRHLYEKASLVLWMLMHELGEESFRRVARTYLDTHRFDLVETHDLEAAVREVTGRNPIPFFETWVHRAGHPDLTIKASQEPSTSRLRVSLSQRYEGDPYRLTLPLWIKTDKGEHTEKLSLSEKRQTYLIPLDGTVLAMSADPYLSVLATCRLNAPLAWLTGALEAGPTSAARTQAASQLATKRQPDAVAALERALNEDPFWGVAGEAARALGRVGTPDARRALLEARGHEHPKVRRAVARALGSFRHPEAGAALAGWLKGGDASYFVEAEAARSLGKSRHEDALEALTEALGRPSWVEIIRSGALDGLATLDTEEAVEQILPFLRRGQPEPARVSALRAVSKTSALRHRVWAELESLQREDTFRIRLALIDAAGRLGGPRGEAILSALTQVPGDGRVRRRASEALSRARKSRPPAGQVSALRGDLDAIRRTNEALWSELRALQLNDD